VKNLLSDVSRHPKFGDLRARFAVDEGSLTLLVIGAFPLVKDFSGDASTPVFITGGWLMIMDGRQWFFYSITLSLARLEEQKLPSNMAIARASFSKSIAVLL
jgi:hypothetical protein